MQTCNNNGKARNDGRIIEEKGVFNRQENKFAAYIGARAKKKMALKKHKGKNELMKITSTMKKDKELVVAAVN